MVKNKSLMVENKKFTMRDRRHMKKKYRIIKGYPSCPSVTSW